MDGRASAPQFAMVVLLRLAACSTSASQFSMVAPHRSQAHSRRSLLHWAHRRLLHPQFAMVVLLRPTACSTPASQFSMVASLRSQSSLEMLPASLGSSTAIAATGCAVSFALIGLTTACFRHRRRPSCAPPVSAKILRIFGRGNCKETIFALENGIFLRKNRPVPAVHAAGDD